MGMEIKNFIEKIIDDDNVNDRWGGRVHTRFPPEPNGYLHIGHAKSICLNFGIAELYNGKCNLRFDDTNPLKEDSEYVRSIIEDVKWLGFDWQNRLYYASDYFDKMYEHAITLIKNQKAYVCDQTNQEIRKNRGTLTEHGINSPFRKRGVEENLDLFIRMKNGEFENGAKTLRAKIDMSHSNLNMRDPVIYRILHANHHRTGDKWCIYPMYDWAHGIEDSIESITHSICTLEFEDHRTLYDWYLNQLEIYHPQQIEFSRLNLNFTILSKRKLKQIVEGGYVSGWDDPRMPTISGLRNRGYTPNSIKKFAEEVGVTKRDSIIDVVRLENSLREELNKTAHRVMGVLKPLKLIITNYPSDKIESLDAINNPENPDGGSRKIKFSGQIYIEKDDFKESPPKKFFRLAPGKEVRLKYAYIIKCTKVLKDDKGNVTEIHCTYDPKTKSGSSGGNRKVKGTIHWVSAEDCLNADIRIYDRLFKEENPEIGDSFIDNLNPDSLKLIKSAKLEISLKNVNDRTYQFERLGYFKKDEDNSRENKIAFMRVVSLRDKWAKILKQITKNSVV